MRVEQSQFEQFTPTLDIWGGGSNFIFNGIESAKLLGPIIKILLIGIKLHMFVCHLMESILIRFSKYHNRTPLIY